MDEYTLRDKALAYAIAAGGTTKNIVSAAADFYAFLSSGNVAPSTSKSSSASGASDAKADAPDTATPAPTPSSDKPATETAQPEQSPSDTPTGSTTTSTGTSPSEVSRTDAMKAMGQFIALKGEADCVAILARFNASKFSEIDPAKYGELVAAFEAGV